MKDSVIPIYALDECTIDPLRFDPMPPAIFGGKIRQHGRLHMTVIHDNFYVTDDALPQSDGECEDYIPTSKGNPEPE